MVAKFIIMSIYTLYICGHSRYLYDKHAISHRDQ